MCRAERVQVPGEDSHCVEDGKERNSAGFQESEPIDLSPLHHLEALSPQGQVSTRSAGWNSSLLRKK